MTTDTHKKEYAIQFELGGKTCTLGAIGKGSGMIAPNMATMLAFYTTDAAVSPALLEKALKTVVPGTYNQMSVDLDTSTNDTLIIMASGLAGNPEITEENADYHAFVAALTAIAEHMCAEHAGDGEGATHLITCEVTHAPDLKTARAVSRSVVCSNLFKAAVFGRDANWGRILCAIGYTPGDFSIDKVCVWLSRPPVRSTSARTPPTTPTARMRPQRFWRSTTCWSRWIWAPVKPAAKPGAVT